MRTSRISRVIPIAALVAAAASAGFPAASAQSPGAGAEPRYWAPKSTRAGVYVAPNRPHVRLADLKARHAGESGWRELVLRNEHLQGEYVADAPGTKVSPRFQLDTREWWIVVEGEMRVNIEGEAEGLAGLEQFPSDEEFVAAARQVVAS